ncbi:dihydrodipicolinate synthase family protein [Planctomicrobium sp. SH664]|uniref:dihydrodipicolinate synthase family protein n=1 Tax=Planctomicrobium sp. SH664 TaxID=3448125 RepID=UPI003F5BABDF
MMNLSPMTSETLAASVIAVPPLARYADLTLNDRENERLIRYLEAAGVRTLLYGGNAALAHVAISEYAPLLQFLTDTVDDRTTVVPPVGPTYGMMMDQEMILRDFAFSTAMLLPSRDAQTPSGLVSGVRRFVDRSGRPIVLYLKNDDQLDVKTIQGMMNDGLISWIKYAVPRESPSVDPFLRKLVDAVGPSLIVSGFGEQPAIVHLRDFGLASFTSGCVCIAPQLSLKMLLAIQREDYYTAERICQQFAPLENLRDLINPVQVLHAAVALAGIAETGSITPFWSSINEVDQRRIQKAAGELMQVMV